MKNNFIIILILILFNSVFLNGYSEEEFNFNVTELNILEDGNLFVGSKGGTVSNNNGIVIKANNFRYDKKLNILNAKGNVEITDKINNYIIKTENIVYNKKKNLIYTEKKSAAYSLSNDIIINAQEFVYKIEANELIAKKNVLIKNERKNYRIYSDYIEYYKNLEKIFSKGKTRAKINSKYDFSSSDVTFFNKTMELKASKNTKIIDNNTNLYKLSKFHYSINKEILKGENILININYNLPKNEKIYFSSAIIDLKNKNFTAKDPEIRLGKSIFDNSENDPRIKGISSTKKENITIINKGVFTSCKENPNESCPPWSVQADKIKHDRNKKQLIYDNAVVKIYDYPVFYFPKFFHPDPTVERQTGFLKPKLNNSNILGSSITMPYFKIVSIDQDITFKPTWFDSGILMAHNEYRKVTKNSNLLADIGFVNGYKSTTSKKKKNINHFFANYELDLGLTNYTKSILTMAFERVNNDTYLKVFSPHITNSSLRPKNFNNLNNNIKFFLENDNYNFESGIEVFENLQSEIDDKYEYVFPYYNYNKIINSEFFNGNLNFTSEGNNILNDTNKLESSIINDFVYNGQNFFSNMGFKNDFNVYLKNLISSGKNSSDYKSSAQIELVSLFENNLSIPLTKENGDYLSLLTPQASLRINPSDMKNYANADKNIDIGNVFNTNRLGISDTFEAGKSLTVGLSYSKEKKEIDEINKYFEFKLATVLRDKEEIFIPKKSTINKKNSNLFGSIKSDFSDNLNLNYNFALDNNYEKFEYNNLETIISFDNFITNFSFVEENGEMGDSNVVEGKISYIFDDNNSFSFSSRRNRKINLTEYYNLVYEYKNDCLTAGIKYKKSYYEDRDLKPSEDLLFTVTLYPLTSFDQNASGLLGN